MNKMDLLQDWLWGGPKNRPLYPPHLDETLRLFVPILGISDAEWRAQIQSGDSEYTAVRVARALWEARDLGHYLCDILDTGQ